MNNVDNLGSIWRIWDLHVHPVATSGNDYGSAPNVTWQNPCFYACGNQGKAKHLLTIDPKYSEYPYFSSYLFAGDNPIRFIDVEGAGKGDAVFYSDVKGTGNVLIYLVDKGQDYSSDLAGRIGNWDVIAVSNLELVNDELKQKYGDAKINNLVIRTHGACHKGENGITLQETTEGGYINIQTFTGNELLDPESYQDFTQIGNMPVYDNRAPMLMRQATAISQIASYLNQDAKVVFVACGSGKGNVAESFIGIAEKYGIGGIEVFTNGDRSTGTTESYISNNQWFNFNSLLTTDDDLGLGWKKTVRGSDGNFKNTFLGNKVPYINSFDKIEFRNQTYQKASATLINCSAQGASGKKKETQTKSSKQ